MMEADYWHNRHAFWAPGNTIEWYENGNKKKQTWVKYKDTIGVYNPVDSTYAFKGLYKLREKVWWENGKVQCENHFKNGQLIYLTYNAAGDTLLRRDVKTIRTDGYDTLQTLSISTK
jgi:antitoxin component YwqK of YwqJK toxin-antitoxin module